MIVLSEAVGLLRFLFVEDVEIEPAAAEKQLSGPDAAEVLDAATTALTDAGRLVDRRPSRRR